MTNKAWLGIGAVAVTLVASGTVLAQQRVLAEATLVHQDDCIDSEVEIFVQANSANRGTFEVSAFEIDTCAEEDGVLLDARGRGNLAQGGFSFDGRRAVLNTTVQLRDALTRNAVSMELDLTWVGGEQVVATTRRDIQSRGRFARANRGLTRTLAEAEASGTVAVEGPVRWIERRRYDLDDTLARCGCYEGCSSGAGLEDWWLPAISAQAGAPDEPAQECAHDAA